MLCYTCKFADGPVAARGRAKSGQKKGSAGLRTSTTQGECQGGILAREYRYYSVYYDDYYDYGYS